MADRTIRRRKPGIARSWGGPDYLLAQHPPFVFLFRS
jgi:hypothetical protein